MNPTSSSIARSVALRSGRQHPVVTDLWFRACLLLLFLHAGGGLSGASLDPEARPPRDEAELRFWLENMVVHHRFTDAEVTAATGLGAAGIAVALDRHGIRRGPPMARPRGAALKVLPYPGGRHPRLGFFDGAIRPQRETKLSVSAPWDEVGYVVVDVPEAIWSDLGLTYLAHTHISTIWDKQGVKLPRLEWERRADGTFAFERPLPNGIVFGASAVPRPDHVAFGWWLRNGTAQTLTNLRAQVCVMLGRATGFAAQTNANKLLDGPFAAARDDSGRRWVITAWDTPARAWQNQPVPCIHSDPQLPDCPPGETRAARGWLWFYEGGDIRTEFARLRRKFLDQPARASLPATKVLEPIPDKLVVLTFDDSVASHHSVVRPLLKRFGFGATFFITEGFSFRTNKQDYLTWEQIAELHRDGFEIGNHTRDHLGVSADTLGRLREQVEAINARCAEHGLPRPVSFAYPGNAIHPGALPLLKELGFRFARRGAQPEFAYESGRGIAYEPGADHPLLIPTAGDARPAWTLENLKHAVELARDGRIAVLQFHGVPDRDHPWVHTPPEKFESYLGWLHANGYRVIALRDLARYVDPANVPAEPWAIIERRQAKP